MIFTFKKHFLINFNFEMYLWNFMTNFTCNVWTHKVQKTQKFSSFHFIIFTFILSLQKLIKYILSYFIELDPYLQERSYFYSYTLSTIYNITRYFGQKFQMQHKTCHSLFIPHFHRSIMIIFQWLFSILK
jgi:hypothetical protein